MQLLLNEEPVVELKDMSEEEFFEFCALNRDRRIERTASGDVIIMPPVAMEFSDYNAEITMQLRLWAKKDRRGRAYESSAGFTLPNSAVLSPDAAWVSNEQLKRLTPHQRRRFAPVCPEFVIELVSPSNRLTTVKAKMAEWIENGALLGWMIDVDREQVHIYRPGRDPERLHNPDNLLGEGPVNGFVLDLTEIW